MLPLNKLEAPQSINPEVRGIMMERLQTVWTNLSKLAQNPTVATAFQTVTPERTPAPERPQVEASVTPSQNVAYSSPDSTPQATSSYDDSTPEYRIQVAQEQVEAVFAGKA